MSITENFNAVSLADLLAMEVGAVYFPKSEAWSWIVVPAIHEGETQPTTYGPFQDHDAIAKVLET